MIETRPCRRCNGSGKESDPYQIGQRMRKLRESKKITLRELARRMDLTPAYVSDLELGKRGWNEALQRMYRKHLKTVIKQNYEH